MAHSIALGIDIGGSGIKGAPVDLTVGDFAADRLRIATPAKSTPDAVATVVREIADHFSGRLDPDEPIGVALPAPSVDGVVPMMANLHKSWIGANAQQIFEDHLERPVCLTNDADAAGVAEAAYGAAKGVEGLVFLATLGTGIGTALLFNGRLIPNTELGHVELDGHDAETQAASSVKEKLSLTYEEWAPRLQRYLSYIEGLLYPQLIVLGGGISKKADKFIPLLDLRAPIVAAELKNSAGIVGAAARAHAIRA